LFAFENQKLKLEIGFRDGICALAWCVRSAFAEDIRVSRAFENNNSKIAIRAARISRVCIVFFAPNARSAIRHAANSSSLCCTVGVCV
jgi:hypothetical protein